jgi:hypothetical protein
MRNLLCNLLKLLAQTFIDRAGERRIFSRWMFERVGEKRVEERGERKRTASIAIGNIDRNSIAIEVLNANTVETGVDGDRDSIVNASCFEILEMIIG